MHEEKIIMMARGLYRFVLGCSVLVSTTGLTAVISDSEAMVLRGLASDSIFVCGEGTQPYAEYLLNKRHLWNKSALHVSIEEAAPDLFNKLYDMLSLIKAYYPKQLHDFVNQKDVLQTTPLRYALEQGNAAVVVLLMLFGAEFDNDDWQFAYSQKIESLVNKQGVKDIQKFFDYLENAREQYQGLTQFRAVTLYVEGTLGDLTIAIPTKEDAPRVRKNSCDSMGWYIVEGGVVLPRSPLTMY